MLSCVYRYLEKQCGIPYARLRMFLTTKDGWVEEFRYPGMPLHSYRIEDDDVLNLQVRRGLSFAGFALRSQRGANIVQHRQLLCLDLFFLCDGGAGSHLPGRPTAPVANYERGL